MAENSWLQAKAFKQKKHSSRRPVLVKNLWLQAKRYAFICTKACYFIDKNKPVMDGR